MWRLNGRRALEGRRTCAALTVHRTHSWVFDSALLAIGARLAAWLRGLASTVAQAGAFTEKRSL